MADDPGRPDDPAGGDGQASQDQPAGRDHQAEADAYLAQASAGLPPEEAAHLLATVANRAAVRLHNVARGEATTSKGTPAWPAWAALQNAARNVVLQTTTGRDLAARLAGRRR